METFSQVESSTELMMEKKERPPKKRSLTWMITAVIFGIFLVLLVLAVIGLATGLGVSVANTAADLSTSEDLCLTTKCVELSNQISSYMDMSVDPCEDFYAFACNGFREEAIIPFGQEAHSVLSQTTTVNTERIRSLMESENNRNLSSLQKAITFYQSCLDLPTIDEQSLPALHQVLHSLGGWPLVGMDINTTWSINDENGYLIEQLYDSTAFFLLSTTPDVNNSTNNLLSISQGGLTVPSQAFYASNESTPILALIMVQVFQAINPNMPMDSYIEAAMEIVGFESQLAQIIDFNYMDLEIYDIYNTTTYNYLVEIFPEFNWISNMQFYGNLGNFNVKPTNLVALLAPIEYLIGLNELIRATESRILQNYAKWHFVFNLLQDLSSPFRDIYYQVQAAATGETSIPSRYVLCVNEVQEGLKYAVARAFTEEYVSSNIMNNISVILDEIQKVMSDRIREKEWLDDATKERALNKLDHIQNFIAYPEEIFNNSFLDSFYSSFDISISNGHFINKLNTRRSCNIFKLSYIGRTNVRAKWYLNYPSPTVVNAYYRDRLNQIYFHEGILDTPVFESYWPDYFKYSTLGLIAGHQYTNGFDIIGRRFDEYGNLVNWWSESSLKEFNRRTQCFVEQYSNYSIQAGKVDGNLTLAENIADNGGLVMSYLAYKNIVKKNGEEKRLPGLPFTQDQLFFIGASQVSCFVSTVAFEARLLSMSLQSPDSIRTLGILANSQEFAEAFNCPAGSRMNPIKKCELW